MLGILFVVVSIGCGSFVSGLCFTNLFLVQQSSWQGRGLVDSLLIILLISVFRFPSWRCSGAVRSLWLWHFLVMFTYRKQTFAGNLDSITPLWIYKIKCCYPPQGRRDIVLASSVRACVRLSVRPFRPSVRPEPYLSTYWSDLIHS